MKYRVLGDMEIRISTGQHVLLSRPRSKQVLATLLIFGNSVVPPERLIDYLWENQPPESACSVIKTCVWGLGGLLSPGGSAPCPIETLSGGYRVAVAPNELDMLEFSELARQGRLALRSGDLHAAERVLRRSLDLWRGDALADVPLSSALRAVADRLDDDRLGVFEDWVESRLLLGGHAGVISELRHWVKVSPMRERLRGQLILALYRSGRQGEALAEYRELRRELAEKPGIESCPLVQRLHQQMLAADPSLLRAVARRDGL